MKLPTYTSILILFHNLPSHDGFSSTSLYRNCAHKLICNKPSTYIFAKTTTITQLSESTQDEAGDGWYDDYDDFVSNLDFEGGGWDSGADSPFEGDGYGGGGRGRGRGGGRGGGKRMKREEEGTWQGPEKKGKGRQQGQEPREPGAEAGL